MESFFPVDEEQRRRKMGKGSSWSGVLEIWNRETGNLKPRVFSHRFWASKDLVLRFSIHKKLVKHSGCVNTVNFNADGKILITGSDDRKVMLWDWDMSTVKLEFHTGHGNNIFDAKFVPYTDDTRIVTCAADGEVRYAQILEGGKMDVKRLAKHEGCANKVEFQPGDPHIFYSCGEDGLVHRFDLRSESASPFFTCNSLQKPSFKKITPLYTMVIHPRNPNIIAVAGSDEYARLFDIRKCQTAGRSQLYDCFCPPHLINDCEVGITGLAFSIEGELLASYGNELIYLFDMDRGLGPDFSPPLQSLTTDSRDENRMIVDTASTSSGVPEARLGFLAYGGHYNRETVKGVNFFGPNSEYVVSGSDCGRIFIWRKKDGELLRAMQGDKHVVNCIRSHPCSPILASSGIEHSIKIWMPNASEPLPPIDMDEVLKPDRIGWFDDSDSGTDYDVDSDDDSDASDDDDDDDNVDQSPDSEFSDDVLSDSDEIMSSS